MHSFISAGSVPGGSVLSLPTWSTGAHKEHIPVTLITAGLLAGICCLKRLYSLMSRLTALTLTKPRNKPDLSRQVLNQLARACSKTTEMQKDLTETLLSDKPYFKQPP